MALLPAPKSPDPHTSHPSSAVLAHISWADGANDTQAISQEPFAAAADAARAALTLELTGCVDRCFKLSATLNTCGRMDAADIRLLKRLRKAAGRTSLRSEAQIRALRDECLAFERALQSRIPTDQLKQQKASEAAAVSPKPAPRPKPPLLPMPLTEIPGVALLQELDKTEVDWEILLSSPTRTREISLEQVAQDGALQTEISYRTRILELRGAMSAKEAAAKVLDREPHDHEIRTSVDTSNPATDRHRKTGHHAGELRLVIGMR
jgi:hypothetical protein